MHQIQYRDYHCSVTEKQILKDLNRFAFDPLETDSYHGWLRFHRDMVFPNRDEAMTALEKMCRRPYDDHAVMYKDGRKKWWLVKVEWHC